MTDNEKARAIQWPRRRMILALLVLCAAGGGIGLGLGSFGTGSKSNEGSTSNHGDMAREREDSAVALAAEYLNSKLDVDYVGTAACAECHEKEFRTHRGSSHQMALKEIDPATEPPDGTFFHPASGRKYTVYRRDGEFRHRESKLNDAGVEIVAVDHAVKYLVGSGHHTRSYLIDIDGFLMESPITWYTSRKIWELSPGYNRPNHRGFERPTDGSCLYCHMGRMANADETLHRLKFVELGIGCERCHGPGALHVAQQRQRRDFPDAPTGDRVHGKTIVNPATASREIGESICAHCHLMGDGLVIRDAKSIHDFRPGLRLSDVCLNYQLDEPNAAMKVVGHVSQMRASRCYQKSPTMTCTTCHPGHDETPRDQLRSRHLQICLDCHGDDQRSRTDFGGPCGLNEDERLRRNSTNDCISCHMPQVETDLPHVAFTHHRIGIHDSQPSRETKGGRNPPPELVALDDVSQLPRQEQQRNLALGYFGMAQRTSDSAARQFYRNRAKTMLERLLAEGWQSSDTTAALSQLSFEQGTAEASLSLARQALRYPHASPKIRVNILYMIAQAQIARSDWRSAITALDELVTLRCFSGDWKLRGLCRRQLGNLSGSLQDWQRAAAINPFDPEVHSSLAELYDALGKASDAEKEREIHRELTMPRSK